MRARLRRALANEKNSARIALLRMLPQFSRPMTIALIGLTLVAAVVPVAAQLADAALIGKIDEVLSRGISRGAVVIPLIIVGSVFGLQQVAGVVRAALGDSFGRRINGRVRHRVMAATLKPSGIAHLEDPDLLDKVSVARGAGTGHWKPGDAVSGLSQVWSGKLSGIFSAIILARFSVVLALGVLITWIVLIRRFRQAILSFIAVHMGETESLRRADYFRDLSMTPVAAKETRMFGLAGWIVDQFTFHAFSALKEVWRQRSKAWGAVAWGAPLVLIVHFIAFAVIGRAGAHGLNIGLVTLYAQSVFGIVGGFANLGESDMRIEYGAASIPAMLELEKHAASEAVSGSLPAEDLPLSEIRFEDVRFRYPGQKDDVFEGLTLSIPAGKSMAIVGANGAGKTTLVKLLARLYDPSSGSITVDGTDLRDFDPVSWQRRIAAIFQDFVRYPFDASDNVGFGAIHMAGDQAGLNVAAAKAGASEDVAAMGGWNTVLSRQYSGGTDLSGGQWQRIALSRAFFAVEAGAGVLVLDEPTANLDVRSEAKIYDRFLELTAGLTTLVISHRFSTVRRADRICVVKSGRVIEEGNHDELLAANGTYARMFRLQAARFEPVS